MTDELAELCLLLRERAALDVVALTAAGGESKSTFWMTDGAGVVRVLKIMRDAPPDRAGSLRALGGVLERLRGRGYPAPAIEAVGHVPGLVFWIQQRMPGSSLDLGGGTADPGTLARLLPELLRLNDAQAGLGTGDWDEWPDLLARTLAHGGDGYCLHDTLRAHPGTRELLRTLRRVGDQCCPAVPAGRDFVHYDFSPANLLSDGTAITGVVDINPTVAGDRAFDLATLLFYCYDHDKIREPLRARLLDLAGPRAAGAYLAHMVLRQVDWSLRFHPGTPATRRHLRLARLVTADIGG